MADNIDITPGAGATVATDEVGGRHYQRVKLTDGAEGSENHASVRADGTQEVSLADRERRRCTRSWRRSPARSPRNPAPAGMRVSLDVRGGDDDRRHDRLDGLDGHVR